ncbi:MAG: PhoH family protein [Pseudomonadota bacterium]
MNRRGQPPEGPRVSRLYPVADNGRLQQLCGPNHAYLHRLESKLSELGLDSAESQGGGVLLEGSEQGVSAAEAALAAFERRLGQGEDANDMTLDGAIESAQAPASSFAGLKGLRRPVTPQTQGQSAYLSVLVNQKIGLTFGVGPAGTGKTFLAVAVAVSELLQGVRERIIITRPAVEAGEKLGFLPGTLEEKVDPYMMPIWDGLRELIGPDSMQRKIERGDIEVAPLAFMRGRTLKNAFVIVDEAQNTTIPQMKMVLTRLGRDSRMVVTGDPGQVDLPDRQPSGLAHALRILDGVPGVGRVDLSGADVVRHDLVSKIVAAYDRDADQSS